MNKHGKTKYKLLEDFQRAVHEQVIAPSTANLDNLLDIKGRLERKLDKMSKQVLTLKIRDKLSARAFF